MDGHGDFYIPRQNLSMRGMQCILD